MVKYPKQGMKYEQAIRNGVRFAKAGNEKLASSVVNQVRLAEGNKAAREFTKEIIAKSKE
jgi:hypothetical protein